MPSMLTLSPRHPFKDVPTNDGCARSSSSSMGSMGSNHTVQHRKIRSISTNSLSSVGSLLTSTFRRQNEHASPRPVSSFNLTLRRAKKQVDEQSRVSRRTSITSVLSSKLRRESNVTEHSGLKLVDLAESEDELPDTDAAPSDTDEVDGSLLDWQQSVSEEPTLLYSNHVDAPTSLEVPFRRWMSTLRRRRRPVATTPCSQRWALDDFDSNQPSPIIPHRACHQKSDSHASSSLGFVKTIKSATVTLATASIATISRRNSNFIRRQHSSVTSGGDPRPSVDTQRSYIDEAAKQRSRKRRGKIEELIRTEENYVADLKALSNAYFTLLGHRGSLNQFVRTSAKNTIAELLHLHDDILGRLHHIVPFAEYDQSVARQPKRPMSHARWHSVDVVPMRSPPARSKLATIRQGRRSLNISRPSEDEQVTLQCCPLIVTAVAKVFIDHIESTRAYEDFAANFEMIQRDIEEVQRNVVAWAEYDRAIEAISAHINPVKTREANTKRATTVKDLLIKPIQRLPRYELLFSDLSTLTPVCDDPEAHAAVTHALDVLIEACQKLNATKEHPSKSRILETTWLIGDRLTFAGQLPRSVFLQLLGQVILCGCLHVAYRGKDRIKGCYFICILFESTLLLASADEDQSTYRSLAGIALANATIEETDNGKGLQCHTAPHSWKLVFEHSGRMYEIILTACSGPEAGIWREHISNRIEVQSQAVTDGITNTFELQSPLTAEMRSIGKAFGKPGSFVRRMSVHRTATVGPTSDLNQVVIKNTQAEKEALVNASSTSLRIPRSQSVFTPSHVQTLAPRRADRARLEALLSDVWTKDLLPYPGMTRRSDPIRASANHVIRKFSVASIASNFSSKRNTSYSSFGQSSRKEDMPPPKLRKAPKTGRPLAQKIDFHNAPEAFLPTDFELENPETKRKKSALRTLTMSIERPFSPLLGNENKAAGLHKAQSVQDATKEAPAHELTREKAETTVYSVVQERAKTPTVTVNSGMPERMPRNTKSKSRLLRLFA